MPVLLASSCPLDARHRALCGSGPERFGRSRASSRKSSWFSVVCENSVQKDLKNSKKQTGRGEFQTCRVVSYRMDGLPEELCIKIFRLLDHPSLAAAPQVCRKWNALTCDNELWRKLFEDRWGADATAFYAPEPEASKPWKDVFVVQDRCDRYGLGVRIIREGNDYYLIHQGEIQSYLGTSCGAKDAQLQSADAEKRQISDRILFFLGDLEAACANAKRVKA